MSAKPDKAAMQELLASGEVWKRLGGFERVPHLEQVAFLLPRTLLSKFFFQEAACFGI